MKIKKRLQLYLQGGKQSINQSIDQSINQSSTLVFRTHQGSQQTITGKILTMLSLTDASHAILF